MSLNKQKKVKVPKPGYSKMMDCTEAADLGLLMGSFEVGNFGNDRYRRILEAYRKKIAGKYLSKAFIGQNVGLKLEEHEALLMFQLLISYEVITGNDLPEWLQEVKEDFDKKY